jgi:hypothetical protein
VVGCTCSALWIFISVALAIGLGVPLALSKDDDPGGWDMSGPAMCYNNRIVFVQGHMKIWKTYPLAPYAENRSFIPLGFTGKNLFAHNVATNKHFTAKIHRIVDNHTVYFEESNGPPFVNTSCYVTIDLSINPNWDAGF